MDPDYRLPHDVAEPGAVVSVLAPDGRVIHLAFIADADLLSVWIDNGYEHSPGTRFWRSTGAEVVLDGTPGRSVLLSPYAPPPIERGPEPGRIYETWEESVRRHLDGMAEIRYDARSVLDR